MSEGGVEKGRDRIPRRLHTEHGAWHEAPSQNHERMTWADIKSLTLKKLRYSGTPTVIYLSVEKCQKSHLDRKEKSKSKYRH